MLSQQSSFGVEKSCSFIANYYIFLDVKVVDSFQNLLKMGTKRLSMNLEFRNFGVFTLARLLLPQRICLYSLHSKICSSTHSIVNSSWLAHDHTVLLHHMLTQHSLKCEQAPFLIFWEGPGDEATDLYRQT